MQAVQFEEQIYSIVTWNLLFLETYVQVKMIFLQKQMLAKRPGWFTNSAMCRHMIQQKWKYEHLQNTGCNIFKLIIPSSVWHKHKESTTFTMFQTQAE
jgi:hypothetical protein